MTTDGGFVLSGALGMRRKGFIVTACALPAGAAGLTLAGGSEFSGGLGTSNRGKPFIFDISLAFHRNRASAAGISACPRRLRCCHTKASHALNHWASAIG
jgi:hypothetical protein